MQRHRRVWTQQEAKENALALHPDCDYAEIKNGLAFFPIIGTTWVVECFRNEECWAADDPPKYVEEGYYAG